MGGAITNAIQYTNDWIKAPFKQQMSLLDLALLVGLIMVLTILWTRILAHFGEWEG